MTRLSPVITLGACALFSAAAYATDATPASPKWAPWIDAEWNPGTHRSIGQFDAFAPVMQSETSLLFVNPRMRFDDQDSQEYNWGLGYRRMVDKDWIIGGYSYIDRTVSGFSNHFQEVTIGLEALSEDWKLRVNDYQPFGVRSYSGQNAQAIVTGGNIGIQSNTERSMQGEDIEAGYRVPMNDATAPDQLWVYAGGYRFSAPEMRTVEGPRARFEYEIGDVTVANRTLRLRLSGEVQHDDVRSTQWFAGIRIGIPLGDEGATQHTSRLTPLERHMADPVHRDVDIVTNTGGATTEAAVNAYNNQQVSGITTIDANTSNVASAVTSAGANSVVVFNGSAGTITLPSSTGIDMVSGQTLLGGGSFLSLRGAQSGVSAVYYVPGSTPTLTGTVSTSLVNLANNSVVQGFNVANTNGTSGSSAIASNGATNVTIAENFVTLSTNGSRGIDASNSSNSIVTGNTITATSQTRNNTGIHADNTTALTIDGNTINFITNPGGILGISEGIAAGGTQLAITDNTLNISSNRAITLGYSTNTAHFANITRNILNLMSGNSSRTYTEGIFVGQSDGIVIDDNVISTNVAIGSARPVGYSAIYIYNSADVTVRNNTMEGLYASALIFSANPTVSGTGNSYIPTFSSSFYPLFSTNRCVIGTAIGSIGFADGYHCP